MSYKCAWCEDEGCNVCVESYQARIAQLKAERADLLAFVRLAMDCSRDAGIAESARHLIARLKVKP